MNPRGEMKRKHEGDDKEKPSEKKSKQDVKTEN